MKKKVLVTGGAGFIGGHLCRRLVELGYYVICVDNLVSGSRDNIKDLLNEASFEFIEHNIIVPISIEVDEIYNLACPASPKFYQKNPITTVKTNVLGSINLLDLAKKTGARILQASTSEIYGNPELHPQPEYYWGNVNTIGPRSCYDEGKRVAETLFFDYHRRHSVDIRVIRIFNTYGPYMKIDDGRVISNLIVQALQNKDMTIYGNGTQTRSFCYISDLIEGIIRSMNNKHDYIGPLNIGNPSEIKISELAERIINLTDSKSKIAFSDLPIDDPIRRKPDIRLAEEIIDWSPQIELEEGLLRTINFFKKRLRTL